MITACGTPPVAAMLAQVATPGGGAGGGGLGGGGLGLGGGGLGLGGGLHVAGAPAVWQFMLYGHDGFREDVGQAAGATAAVAVLPVPSTQV